MVDYLVYGTSAYTKEQFKSFKSLEAYNQFVSGWVRDLCSYNVQGTSLCILTCRVMHSQRLSETALKPWVIAKMDGEICSAHCDCMAGLAETCTHIGALLFATEFLNRQREMKTVTQVAAYWLVPSVSKADYREVKEIDFTSARSKKIRMDNIVEGKTEPIAEPKQCRNIPNPTQLEIDAFCEAIHRSASKPAILSLVPPYSGDFVPKATDCNLPGRLDKLYDIQQETQSYHQILGKCEDFVKTFTVTERQSSRVEELTRKQSESKLWYGFRAGRITASKLKQVCHSDPRIPAKSLINTICYPDKHKFSTAATRHGIDNEDKVLDMYAEEMKWHDNFVMSKTGLVINTQFPYLGASPDSLVSCECCGNGCVEVKCPYSKRDMTIRDAIEQDKTFCLEIRNDEPKLKQNHQYYYQVQAQIHCTNTEYADFIVWTGRGPLHKERILPDLDFWEVCVERSSKFFLLGILPELLGKFYTRPLEPVQQSASVGCFCNNLANWDETIKCGNNKCPYGPTFHISCMKYDNLNLTEHQKKLKNWYCPYCAKQVLSKKRPRSV
ncbi:uncharacterized protein [Amphiura filiformis]|uniref:uncharacterized protein n=1 Tax=Amphiura filiformis TaxID=82378 RepID=UPI003B220EB9